MIDNACSFQPHDFQFVKEGNTPLNPTLHGLKNVAGDMGGGHYGHPLENDPRGHFCGQIDL